MIAAIKTTIVKARKEYTCNLTFKKIKIGEYYQRLNSRMFGIFHFHISVDYSEIVNYFMNEWYLPSLPEDSEERNSFPAVWDQDEQEIWDSMREF